MMLRLVTEYREIFEDHIARLLSPRDVATVGMVSVGLRILRSHPAAVHVRAFWPTVLALQTPYNVQSCGYFYDAYKGISTAYGRRSVASVRGRTVYRCYSYRTIISESLIVSTYTHMCERCVIFKHGITGVDITVKNARGVDIESLWRIRHVCIWVLLDDIKSIAMLMMRYLHVRDVKALAATCKCLHSRIANIRKILRNCRRRYRRRRKRTRGGVYGRI